MSVETPALRIAIADAGKHVGETVSIPGWLYNLRRSGKICFPQLRDGTGILQCVAVKSSLPEETFEALKNLTQESSLIVTGKLRAELRAPGGYELDVEQAQILQRVPEDEPYPITPKDHGIDFLMDHRHLRFFSRPCNLHRYRVYSICACGIAHGFVNPEPVTSFAVWFESGSKKGSR